MGDNHIYNRGEISKILSKASEIQKKKDLYGDKEGLNKQELIELAKEVGIDPSSLAEAIDVFDKPSFDQNFKWSKITSKIQDVAYVNGELSEELWEEIVQEIRKITGGIGKTSTSRNSFEWEQRRKEFGYKHISLSPQKGKTKIQYVHNWTAMKIPFLIMPAFLGSVFLLVALKGIGLPKSTAVMFAPIGGAIAFTAGATYLRYYFEREKSRLTNLIGAISKKLGSAKTPKITIEDEEIYNQTNATQTLKKNIRNEG